MRKIKSLFAAFALLGVLGAGGVAMADNNGLRGPSMEEKVEGSKIVVPAQARFDSRYDHIMVRRGFVWVAGHYERQGRHRVFIPGHYEKLRRPIAVR